jgi:tetratricopeptide (TPR) repeat protein
MGAVDKIADPRHKRFLQARLWAREGHVKRASWYLAPLVAEATDNPTVSFFAAQALLDNDEAGKALDLYNRGIARHPDALGLLEGRARFYTARRLWDRADKDLGAVIAKAPAARDARMDRALLFGRREWIIDRCQELESVVATWPDDRPALGELGRCKLDRGYVEEADRLFRRAHALAPGDPGTLVQLLDLAERRLDHGAAEGFVHALAAVRPGTPEVILEEAELYRHQGKLEEARRALAAAIERSPDAPHAYSLLAQLALETKDRAGAERWWRLALDRDPENAVLAQRLAALDPAALPLGDRLAPTADDLDRAVRSARGVKVDAGSHRVVLLDDEVTTVHPDGSSKRIVTHVAEAVTTDGRDALIQVRLPTHGKVNVLEAYAVRRSGERQEAASIQGGVVRFRGLEVGSITVVQFVHFAPPPRFLPNEYVSSWRFQDVNAQVESSRWRIVLPRDKKLNVEARGPIERSVDDAGDLRVWSFSAKDVPPLVPEPSMTPVVDELWAAAVSTLESWDAYAHWESALLTEAFQPSPEIDALARKLTAGALTPREKIDRLWAHVAQEIRYQQDYEDTIAGVKPHAAGMVVERGYGDCKDKAVLLIRLARAVGIELRFAVLRTTPAGKVWKAIPNQQFNHAIAYAPRQQGIDAPFFIDTTTNGLDIGNTRADDEGATSLVIDPQGHWEMTTIPYQNPDLELVRHDVTVDLKAPEKATGHDHFQARGNTAASIRVSLRSAEGAKRYYQSLSDAIFAGTTLVSGTSDRHQDLTRPVSIDLDIDLRNAVKAEDDHFRFEVPSPFILAHATALATRRHPLQLWRGTRSLAVEVDLPEGQPVLHLPTDFSVEHPCFTVSRQVATKGTHVSIQARYQNHCAEVAPADYPAFREAVQKALAKTQDTIVFGGKTADKKR